MCHNYVCYHFRVVTTRYTSSNYKLFFTLKNTTSSGVLRLNECATSTGSFNYCWTKEKPVISRKNNLSCWFILVLQILYSILSHCLSTATAQKDDFQCPDDFGFYPHHISCDKYWKCDGREAELKTCGNGLAFDDTDTKYLKENCDYLHNVDCGSRSQLGKRFFLNK